MRNKNLVRLVVAIIVVAVLLSSGAVQVNIMNLVNWVVSMAQSILVAIESVFGPIPRDFTIFALGIVAGIVIIKVYDKLR